MEVRYLASVDEVEAAELRCSKQGCSGTVRFDLAGDGDIYHSGSACPRCRTHWASELDASEVNALIAALRRFMKRKRGKETVEDFRGATEVLQPVLVLPPPSTRS